MQFSHSFVTGKRSKMPVPHLHSPTLKIQPELMRCHTPLAFCLGTKLSAPCGAHVNAIWKPGSAPTYACTPTSTPHAVWRGTPPTHTSCPVCPSDSQLVETKTMGKTGELDEISLCFSSPQNTQRPSGDITTGDRHSSHFASVPSKTKV